MLRSLLFIPGNNPAMLQNADIHGADGIILDLEDAVAIDQKDAARLLVKSAVLTLGYTTPSLIIRVNPLETDFCRKDLEAAVPLRPAYIMPTKVGDAGEVERLGAMIAEIEAAHGIPAGSTSLMPLLETARGIENAYAIACAPRVRALLLGAEDYTADLHAIRSKESGEIAYARGRVLNAARAAGIEAIDTPFTDSPLILPSLELGSTAYAEYIVDEYLGCDIPFASEEEKAQLETDDMPVYPYDGSVRRTGTTIVVKFSEKEAEA